MPLVSAVITTRDRYELLCECVRSVARSSHRPLELIIIDDNSSDATRTISAKRLAQMTGRRMQRVRIEHAKTNIKMVKARNLGAKLARGKYIAFIDDDNVIDTDMIRELVAFAEKRPEYGILGPSNYSARTKQRILDGQRINFFTGRTHGWVERSGREFSESDGIPNVFMIARTVFRKAGYFDEDLVQTFTEPDFAFNARRYGIRSAFVSAAITHHNIPTGVYTPRTLGGEYKHKAYYTMRNRGLIIFRYGQWYHRLVYALVFSWLWALIYSVLVVRFGRFDLVRLYWYGWRDAMIFFFSKRLSNSIARLIP